MYPPFPDDDAWIGIKMSESKKKKVKIRLEIVMSYSDVVLPSHSGLYKYIIIMKSVGLWIAMDSQVNSQT